MPRAKAQSAPRNKGKFEARNPKLETISNDKKPQCSKQPRFGLEFLDFDISNFEIVSDFDIWISDFDSLASLRRSLS